MPRPKSELTGQRPRDLSARLTEEQHIMYLRLGGSKWLRALLIQEIVRERKAREDAPCLGN